MNIYQRNKILDINKNNYILGNDIIKIILNYLIYKIPMDGDIECIDNIINQYENSLL